METAVKDGRYMYCIIETSEPKFFGPLGIGERDDELYTISFNNVAAVVSNSPIKKYPVSRENTLAHEKAIEEVMKEYTVLPVRFVTIAEDEAKVKKILEKEHDKFKDLLGEMKGKKELGLKAMFKEDVIYKDILERYEDIKKLKRAAASKPLTYAQRVEIGKRVETVLQKEREIYKEDIVNTLSPLAVEGKTNKVFGDMMILNAAFLVGEEKETEFDQKVNEIVEKHGDKIKFKYVGTLPPFNFVSLVIETGKY